LGTVAYMSPEQVKAKELDARTDLFSFGAVLYEMATGKMPFDGASSGEICGAILRDQPTLPSQVNRQVSPGLDALIRKALEKDRNLRYQSAAEMRTDLQRLKRDSDSQKISGTVSATGSRTAQSKAQLIKALVAAGAALFMVGGLVAYWWRHRPLTSIAFEHYSISPLTSNGRVSSLRISQDGRYLAYTTEDPNSDNLWIQQIATSTNVRLLGSLPAGVALWGVRFSPDGNYIYFCQTVANSTALYHLPVVGGTPVKDLGNFDSGGAISPDGSKIAFTRENLKVTPATYSLFVANLDGTDETQILTLKGEILYGGQWSPDGKTLVVGIDEAGEGNPNALAIVSLQDRSLRRFVHHTVIFHWAWLSDGSGLVVVSPGPDRTGVEATLYQLWTLSVPDAKFQRLTNDLNDYRGVSLTSDSMKLASAQKQTTSSIWIAPTSDLTQSTEIKTGAGQQDGIRALAWLPDNGLLYLGSGSSTQIWRMDRDGNNRKQLTHFKGSSQDASVSADGATILFSHGANVWRMDGDGNSAKQVTTSKRDAYNGEISPDGRWLVYITEAGPLKVSLAGGDPISLDPNGGYPAISRDGRWIAFTHWDEKTKSNLIEMVASDGSGSPRFLPFLPPTEVQQPDGNLGDLPIRWTASGDAITYVRTKDDVSNIWAQPVNGGPAHQLTHFTYGYIWRHAWSPDGKWLAVARGNFSIDAVLLTDLR